MKYAICNETFQDWPFEKAFSYARSIGYTGIEIAPFTLDAPAPDFSTASRDLLKNQIKDAGLECVGLHWLLAKTTGFYLTTPDEAVRALTGRRLADLANLCADLEGTIMVLGSPLQRNLLPGFTHEQAMDFAADTIRRAMPVLEDRGVTLALEPLARTEGDFLNTAALGIELAEKVNSPNCRLHLDVKAMSSSIPVSRPSRKSITRAGSPSKSSATSPASRPSAKKASATCARSRRGCDPASPRTRRSQSRAITRPSPLQFLSRPGQEL